MCQYFHIHVDFREQSVSEGHHIRGYISGLLVVTVSVV